MADTPKQVPPADPAAKPPADPAADPAGSADEPLGCPRGDSTGDRAGFRLAVFGAVLIAVLFTGYGIGRLNTSVDNARAQPARAVATTDHGHAAGAGSPVAPATGQARPGTGSDTGARSEAGGGSDTGAGRDDDGHDHTVPNDGTAAAGAGATVGGLALSTAGLTLVPGPATFTAGRTQPLTFRITGAGGAPVTTYRVVHDKPLHLVVVRRDLSGYQHLHPTMTPDGTWSVDLALARPGSYRAIADFTAVVGGRDIPVTLGVDLTVPGTYAPVPLPAPARAASSTGGFQVSYDGTARTDSTQPLLITVTSAGGAAAELEPYLGAYGHLVVVREGDVGYVHVHPEAQLIDGKVKFWLTAPSPGRYRMFFDFQVAGQVRTAAWTAVIP